MADGVTLLLLAGGWGRSAVEQALAKAHQAAVHDMLEALLTTGLVERVLVATDDLAWTDALLSLPVVVDLDPPGGTFHFGRRLAELIERCGARRVLYAGGGSAPLMNADQWRSVLARLLEAERIVVANNLHSCDWVGFAPALDALPWIACQESDNAIAWTLAQEAGFPVESLPASAAARFDLDTPTDLLIARRHPGIGPRLALFLDGLGWEAPQVDGLLAAMAREGGVLMVAGRTSAEAWMALERATHCWVRVFAEERGMRASGRQKKGAVRSLLADYLDLVGVDGFFAKLAGLADAVLLDSRPILAALGLWPSKPDRFWSDLLRWEEIEDPFLRRFTRAAREACIPVVLGGHSVAAGGLMALIEVFEAT